MGGGSRVSPQTRWGGGAEHVDVVRPAKRHQTPDAAPPRLAGRPQQVRRAGEIETAGATLSAHPRDSIATCGNPDSTQGRIVLASKEVVPSALVQVQAAPVLQAVAGAFEAPEEY